MASTSDPTKGATTPATQVAQDERTRMLTATSPSDIFIPVLGLSGSGKTRFISLCTGEDSFNRIVTTITPHDPSAAPSSQGFTIHSFTHPSLPTHKIHLIDTPSFDVPGLEHDAIFAECTYYLLKSFASGVCIAGLIYTFPINSMRLTGSAWRALKIFKAMVGTENATSTVLVTTMWDRLESRSVGEERVMELVEDGDFWGDFYAAGGHVEPVTLGDRRSALRVVSLLLAGSRGGEDRQGARLLRIQRQMCIEKMKLYETDAGCIAWGGLREERHRLEGEMEAMRGEVVGLIRQSQSREMVKIKALKEREVGMQKGSGELTAMWDRKVRNVVNQLKIELARNQEILEELESCVREGMVEGRYQDKEQRKDIEKELHKVKKKVQGLQKVESNESVAMDVLLTGGKVVGGGLGIAAGVVSLAACSVM